MGTLPDTSKTRLVGRYLVAEPIAAGGMATVHLGRLSALAGFSRIVAVKRLHAHLAMDPDFVEMFLAEARLAAGIRHPNVVSTLDVLNLEDELFVVMDYVEGESLGRLLRAAAKGAERPTVPTVLSIVSDLLRGLSAAHHACAEDGRPLKIIHRDVSPQNVLVGVDGVTRVADFGVAKAAGLTASTRGGIKGKIAYMAPEQLRGETLDHRVDLYAAGLLLWEALTVKRRFAGDNEWQAAAAVQGGVKVPPSEHNPEVSPELDQLVLKSCAVDREERFADADEMLEALLGVGQLATPKAVGAWVRSAAAEVLDKRRRRIADLAAVEAQADAVEVENDVATRRLSSPELVAPGSASSQVHITGATGESLVNAQRRRARTAILIGVAAATGLFLLALVVALIGHLGVPRSVQVAAPAPSVRTTPGPVAPPTQPAAPPAASSVAAQAPEPPPSAAASTPHRTVSHPRRASAHRSRAKRAAKGKCVPGVEYLDKNGVMKFTTCP